MGIYCIYINVADTSIYRQAYGGCVCVRFITLWAADSLSTSVSSFHSYCLSRSAGNSAAGVGIPHWILTTARISAGRPHYLRRLRRELHAIRFRIYAETHTLCCVSSSHKALRLCGNLYTLGLWLDGSIIMGYTSHGNLPTTGRVPAGMVRSCAMQSWRIYRFARRIA